MLSDEPGQKSFITSEEAIAHNRLEGDNLEAQITRIAGPLQITPQSGP